DRAVDPPGAAEIAPVEDEALDRGRKVGMNGNFCHNRNFRYYGTKVKGALDPGRSVQRDVIGGCSALPWRPRKGGGGVYGAISHEAAMLRGMQGRIVRGAPAALR